MSGPYLGEIKIVAFAFAPKGWAVCNGQTMSIAQNQALFSLLGTTYGGNGTVTFQLPDFRGRVPIHMKNDVPQGAQLGEEAHTLITAEMPEHIHSLSGATDTGGLASPLAAGKMLPTSNNAGANVYAAPANLTTLHPASISSVGGGQPHENMQPYLTLNFVIALMGIFPSRN